MTAYEHLFYGFGHVAYAIALSDGKVQNEEKQKLQEIVERQLEDHNVEFDLSSIIFQVVDDDAVFNCDDSMRIGLKNMDLGDQYLTDELKKTFIVISNEIAVSFPPFSPEESRYVNQLIDYLEGK